MSEIHNKPILDIDTVLNRIQDAVILVTQGNKIWGKAVITENYLRDESLPNELDLKLNSKEVELEVSAGMVFSCPKL